MLRHVTNLFASFVLLSTPLQLGAETQADLRVGHVLDLATLNALYKNDTAQRNLTINLQIRLVRLLSSGEHVGELAQSWQISDDYREITLYLDEGAAFSDGTEITPEYVAGYFNYAKSLPESSAASLLEGAEFEVITTELGEALRITYDEPHREMLTDLGTLTLAIQPWHLRDEVDFTQDWTLDMAEKLAYSGPYRLADWNEDGVLRLVQNEGYPRDLSNSARSVDFVLMGGADERTYAMLQAGELDVALHRPSGQAEFLEGSMADFILEYPSTRIQFLNINNQKPPLDQPKLREALVMATNFVGNSQFFEGSGLYEETSIMPAGVSQTLAAVKPDWHNIAYDERLETARNIMRDLGYGPQNQLSLTIAVNEGTLHNRIATQVLSNWSQIYVNASIDTKPWPEHLERTVNGDYDVARMGWAFARPESTYLLDIFKTGHGYNFPQMSDPTYDALLEQAHASFDPETREGLIAQAMNRLYELNAVIPYGVYQADILRRPDLEIKAFEYGGFLMINDVYLPSTDIAGQG